METNEILRTAGINLFFEAKLNLLHNCLTPKGRDNVEWVKGKITIKDDNGVVFSGEIGSQGENEFAILKKASSEDYFPKLSDLRDVLLSEY